MSAIPEWIGRDEDSGRDLFLLQVSSPGALVSFEKPRGHFACLLAWDASGVSSEAVSRVARYILDSGCVFLCAWGPDCERVHDIFDDMIVGDGCAEPTDGSTVMTTWHDQDSLDGALWYLLRLTSPDEPFVDSCRASIAIVVGERDEWSAAVRDALSKPGEFSRRIEDAEGRHAGSEERGEGGPGRNSGPT